MSRRTPFLPRPGRAPQRRQGRVTWRMVPSPRAEKESFEGAGGRRGGIISTPWPSRRRALYAGARRPAALERLGEREARHRLHAGVGAQRSRVAPSQLFYPPLWLSRRARTELLAFPPPATTIRSTAFCDEYLEHFGPLAAIARARGRT